MTPEKIKEEVIHLIYDILEDKSFNANIIEYVDLVDDMGMDSITFILIILEIETRFNITVPDDMLLIENFRHIDSIVSIIEENLIQFDGIINN